MLSSMLRSSLRSTGFVRRGCRSIFIDTQSTPNPHSMKFLPGKDVLEEGMGTGVYFQRNDRKDWKRSPLAKELFKLDEIKGVFFGRDFITITKNTNGVWNVMKPQVFSAILDFYSTNLPVLQEFSEDHISDTTILDTDDEVVATIKELMETRIRPAVQDDGGDIFLEGFDPDTGIVTVRLAGSCVGCPSSTATLRGGVENMLKHYVPEVTGIEDATDHGDGDDEPLVLRHQQGE
jgi:NFU1 iron-sulfur cluster scaffold homolog, mitochondrial